MTARPYPTDQQERASSDDNSGREVAWLALSSIVDQGGLQAIKLAFAPVPAARGAVGKWRPVSLGGMEPTLATPIRGPDLYPATGQARPRAAPRSLK